jgi:hypothetical protein
MGFVKRILCVFEDISGEYNRSVFMVEVDREKEAIHVSFVPLNSLTIVRTRLEMVYSVM